jgi:hypothetical protein
VTRRGLDGDYDFDWPISQERRKKTRKRREEERVGNLRTAGA